MKATSLDTAKTVSLYPQSLSNPESSKGSFDSSFSNATAGIHYGRYYNNDYLIITVDKIQGLSIALRRISFVTDCT